MKKPNLPPHWDKYKGWMKKRETPHEKELWTKWITKATIHVTHIKYVECYSAFKETWQSSLLYVILRESNTREQSFQKTR